MWHICLRVGLSTEIFIFASLHFSYMNYVYNLRFSGLTRHLLKLAFKSEIYAFRAKANLYQAVVPQQTLVCTAMSSYFPESTIH